MHCHIFVYFFLHFIINLSTTQKNEINKLKVVIFFAKTSTSESYMSDSGIKYLNFIEKTRVKHCANTNSNDDSLSSYTSKGSNCKELLKTGIYALISYCRNVLGMTTAIASIENDTFSNGLRFKKSTSEDLEIRFHHPKTIKGRNGIAFAHPSIITQPEHSEVFKIRSRRQNSPNFHEDADLQSLDDSDSKWDIFGVLANIKLTFFGKLLENDNDKKNNRIENFSVDSFKNQYHDNALFDLVTETLASLQDCEDHGFLMIILGGFLTEICDIYSCLMQSVKHVVENTDERNTLIIVTGSCPPDDTEQNECMIPVYIRAPPKANGLYIAAELYDVPYGVKNLLADMHEGNYFQGLNAKRSKRDLTKNGDNESYFKKFSLLSLPFYIFTIILLN